MTQTKTHKEQKTVIICLVLDQNTQVLQIWPVLPLRQYLHHLFDQSGQLCNASKTFPKLTLKVNVQPPQPWSSVFLVCTGTHTFLRKKTALRSSTAQFLERGHPLCYCKPHCSTVRKVCTSSALCSHHFRKWQQSAASSLTEGQTHDFPSSAGYVRVQLHLSGPIPWCWGRCSPQAWGRGCGHLLGCQAPPAGCCCLWSPPSPESTVQSLPWEQKRWEYCTEARLPWRSFGSAPWKPHCILKVATKRKNEDSPLYKIR